RGEGVASEGSGRECERLPGVPDVVQTIAIGAVAVLPGFTPRNAGEDEYDRRGAVGPPHFEVAPRALFGHVRGGAVMVEAIGPVFETAREEVEFGGVEIARGWIHAEGVAVSGGRHAFGGADGGGVEE